MRKYGTLPGLVALFFAPSSFALGLGHIELHSALGQPLNAQIPIHPGQTEFYQDDVKISLSVPNDNAPQKNSTSLSAANYKARLVKRGNGEPAIQIVSTKSLESPYIRLVVNLSTSSGKLSREYTILLDPPEFASLRKANEVVALNNAIAEPVSDVIPAQNAKIKKTKKQKTIEAKHKSSQTAITQVKTSVTAEGLQATETMIEPAQAVIAKPQMKIRQSIKEKKPVDFAAVIESAEGRVASSIYGPTQAHETLWSIIKKLPKHEGITPQQIEYAILQKNPRAFIEGNVNGLKSGVILKIPTKNEILSYNLVDAETEIENQSDQWGGIHARLQNLVNEGLEVVDQLEPLELHLQPIPATNKFSKPRTAETDGAAAAIPKENAEADSPTTLEKPMTQFASIAENNVELSLPAETPSHVDVTPAMSAHSQAQVNGDYRPIFETMQSEINMTVKRLDLIQSSQREILNRTSTLNAKQENMQEFLDKKNVELAQLETRLADINKQLLSMQQTFKQGVGIANTQASTGAASTTWSTLGGSLLGFGLLAGGLLGGYWYLRRREWVFAGDADNMAGIEYEDMSEAANADDASVEDANFTAVDESLTSTESHDESLSPIDEAEVLITHERYEQAESVLKDAIKRQPKRIDYYQKLLEVYAAADNKKAFESTLSYMTQDLNLSDPDTLSTISALKNLTWGQAVETDDDEVSSFTAVKQEEEPPLSMDETDSLSFSGSSRPFAPPMAEVESESTPSADDDVLISDESDENVGKDDVLMSPARLSDVSADSLKLSDDVDDAKSETELSYPDSQYDPNEASSPESALELAKAYIELEEIEAATSLLAKVQSEGNAKQIDEANQLLKKIG